MEVVAQSFKNCDLVKATGRVDAYTASQLERAFTTITGAGRYHIVFDMGEVDYISTAGLMVLIAVLKECKRFNRGKLVLASVSPLVHRSLEVAGFYTVFDVYETTLEAVGSM